MDIIKFQVEGIFNSFRVPFFRTYHKTFLAPPKTTILGMLTNIMGKSEKFYYNIFNEDKIKVSVVINSIKGKAKDLWSYKSLESKGGMHGRSIVRRDRLFNARYTIYLKIGETSLGKEVFNSLVYPKAVPSLGLDDELIKISSVKNDVKLIENDTHIINSVFMDKGYEYEVKVKDFHKDIEVPTANIVPLKYIITEKKNFRTTRKATEEYKQVEYINCYVKLKDIESFICGENRIVFY
ncbi:CRISPR-associated protein Cas5 [Clostridium coskatii]|uniref:CRISPR-associated protein (Cas_Cas5) n=1 Tax=Clostridium coskatii TaxID=1705578 RepID=A0A166SP16_9CLOT|nr:CRISPR-associated protein Cas5 [Clostridium coskatii]OAA92591.1 CRISPR-associated protein (Cas_Cas5) [Clostridium coskatii]OBR91520.1 CRISPR-associated protein (Cas_Cas5) [Clostridium coskatii]